MQRISNLEEVIPPLKLLLKKYLDANGTKYRNNLFTCPNRNEHSNEDDTPSCGFIPETDNTIFHCFACQARGDIFTAYSYIEEKPIKGIAFHGAVKELCDKYGLAYKQKDLSPEEEQFQTVQQTLIKILAYANKYLVEQNPYEAISYLNQRNWCDLVEHFQFGFLPDTPEVRQTLDNLSTKIPYLEQYIKLTPFQLVDRLLYPIKDPYGTIIGLMDRKISEHDLREKYQKYFLKTLEKGEVLFNLQTCYPEVYLVEGGSSVFTMYKQGIKNVVSMLGKEFTENMYKALVKYGVKKVIICFDGDKQGFEGLKKTIEFFEKHPDIKAAVKLLENDLDPDDFIRKEGVDAFKAIPEISIFKYQLENFQNTGDELAQDEYKRSMMEILSNTKDKIVANKMIDMLCRETNLSKKMMLTELQQYEATKGIASDVSIGSIISEENHLAQQVEEFEQRALRCGRLQGPSSGFPVFDSKTDGLQDGLILISGKWNVGKSAFMQTIALNLLQDPSNFVLYFSIDDSVIGKTIPRFLANMCGTPINTILNPIYGIDQNETITFEEKQEIKARREIAIAELKKYSGRLSIKDSVDGSDVHYIEKIIKTYRAIAGDRKLVVFVDFLNMVNLARNTEKTEQESLLAGFFKHMSTKYSCPVICTVESTKEILTTKTTENSIKGSSSLQFRSDLTLLLYSDFEVETGGKMFFHDDDGDPHPIVKVRISKNKMGSFRGDIYYKFYKDLSKFEEIEEQQQQEMVRQFGP